MYIIEHQNIHFKNLISYNTKVRYTDILKLTQYISDNLHVLNLKKNDNIIFNKSTHVNEKMTSVEIMIPVKGKIEECDEYGYKSAFNLNNAVIIRHEGSLNDLSKTEAVLQNFIKEHIFQTSTEPYYVIIKNGNNAYDDCIIDICIGIS